MFMRPRAVFLSLVVPILAAVVPGAEGGPAVEPGFTPLLVAPAASAWAQCGPGGFTLKDGTATARGGMGLWWYTNRVFTNFVLRGEFVQEQPAADSGVFVRFPPPGGDITRCASTAAWSRRGPTRSAARPPGILGWRTMTTGRPCVSAACA